MRSYDYIEEDEVPEDVLAKIKKVRNMSDVDFFGIVPIWEQNPDKMQFPVIPDAEWCDRIIVDCDVELLISSADNLQNCEFSRSMENDWWEDEKFASTLLRWKEGKSVDPSHVSITNHISFEDGRHRAVLAYALGQKRMKIVVQKHDLQAAIERLDASVN